MSLKENIRAGEELVTVTLDATTLAKEWVEALEIIIQTAQKAKKVGEALVESQKEIQNGIESLIGETEKPTGDEIADPVPGGNGGVFKAKETLSKGHGLKTAADPVFTHPEPTTEPVGTLNTSTLTGETDTDEYGADARGVESKGGAK